ncbi:MAG: glycerophosphodiester phosphodiesterase family protein [Rhodothermales bacterium]|nr:glycerophosphodiester phosphodiesterase family protein [Rhodothermales bacterium]
MLRLLLLGLLAALPCCSGSQPMPPPTSDSFDVQGHRGARGLAPENTLPAFRRALELGVTTLELDTVVSADSQVVVSHEPWFSAEICAHPDGRPVEEAEAEDLLIFQMPYAEVARYDCGSRGHPRFPGQAAQPARKPLLAEVFDLAETYAREHGLPPVAYNVETKARPAWDGRRTPDPETFVRLLWAEVEAADVAGRFMLQSFDVRTLQAARERGLPIRLSLLVERPEEPVEPLAALETGLAVLGFTPDVYSPDYRLVDATVIERARVLGVSVIPWTVNERAEMERLEALGVDGVITDYPDRAAGLREPTER